MKNKISKFSKGNFRIGRPEVVFDETNLILVIGEDEIYHGSFVIRSENENVIRGLVYPSSFRVHFKDPGFEGNPARITFSYDGRGLKPGFVEKGKFTVVCTGGEYELSFTAIIEKPYIMTSYGKVQSTEDFKKLAMKDFSEAVRLFRSRDFYAVLRYEDERIFYLYDNMRKWSLEEEALEEFLVGTKLKECIFLTLPGEGMLFEDVTESTKGILNLMKNTWGYMPIQIECEGDFLKVNKNELSTDEFVGNTCPVEYFVLKEHLHAGRNYGAIKIYTPYETLTYEIEVLQNVPYIENHRLPEYYMVQIFKDYIGYIAQRNSLSAWAESATDRVMQIRKIDKTNEMYQLLQAHIYILAHQTEEAKWILENYNYNRFAIGKDPLTNCYYLFLTALIRDNAAHTGRVLDEIGKTYLRFQDSWLLLYMLLRLDSRYKNPTKRLEVLEQQFTFGTNSALFYLEAYLCYQEKPALLKKLGTFELQVLNFAAKYRLMSKEIALYISNFASQQREFKDSVFRILEKTYKLYPEPTILNAICLLLIRGNKTERKYFPWYQKAVESDFRIARLYEYYMVTLPEDSIKGPLPRPIFLYFMHGNNLDHKKLAFLYANLLTYMDDEALFLGYHGQIAAFARESLKKRHISESLRVIYKRFLNPEEMRDEDIQAVRDICYSYTVTTKAEHVRYVLVIDKDGTVSERVPYEDGQAIIRLYDKESRIVWESGNGRHYVDSIPYETKRMFYEPRFLEVCRRYEEDLGIGRDEVEYEEVTLDLVRTNGIEPYDEKEVFRLCSNSIRESGYKEDDFLLYLSYEMFLKGQYDKVTLTYLAEFYCGDTRNMKKLWYVMQEYHIKTHKLSERIVTQVVFTENLFGEEDIFEDYYTSNIVYFRLKQAYLAYVTREYLLFGREVKEDIFRIVAIEAGKDEEMADVCKLALLEYYSSRSYEEALKPILLKVLREMCEKQLVLPSFLSYPREWLREVQLYDKTMLLYRATAGNKVKLFYKYRKGKKESLGYRSEMLVPVFENLYVRQFVLFSDESITYYIEEQDEEGTITSPKFSISNDQSIQAGKHGRLNAMESMRPKELRNAMSAYMEEEALAQQIFKIIE